MPCDKPMTIVQTNVNIGISICQPMLCGRTNVPMLPFVQMQSASD